MEIQNYLAKPEETIREHRDKLLRELERIWEYGYIQDRELYELIRIACIHHDDGKANPEMQKRLGAARKGKKYRFDPEREIPHNVLSGFSLTAGSLTASRIRMPRITVFCLQSCIITITEIRWNIS